MSNIVTCYLCRDWEVRLTLAQDAGKPYRRNSKLYRGSAQAEALSPLLDLLDVWRICSMAQFDGPKGSQVKYDFYMIGSALS